MVIILSFFFLGGGPALLLFSENFEEFYRNVTSPNIIKFKASFNYLEYTIVPPFHIQPSNHQSLITKFHLQDLYVFACEIRRM